MKMEVTTFVPYKRLESFVIDHLGYVALGITAILVFFIFNSFLCVCKILNEYKRKQVKEVLQK